jgi:exosome complex component RRP4
LSIAPVVCVGLNHSKDIDHHTRTAIARVANITRILAAHFIPLTDILLAKAYDWAVERECSVDELLQADIGDDLVAAATSDM